MLSLIRAACRYALEIRYLALTADERNVQQVFSFTRLSDSRRWFLMISKLDSSTQKYQSNVSMLFQIFEKYVSMRNIKMSYKRINRLD